MNFRMEFVHITHACRGMRMRQMTLRARNFYFEKLYESISIKLQTIFKTDLLTNQYQLLFVEKRCNGY